MPVITKTSPLCCDINPANVDSRLDIDADINVDEDPGPDRNGPVELEPPDRCSWPPIDAPEPPEIDTTLSSDEPWALAPPDIRTSPPLLMPPSERPPATDTDPPFSLPFELPASKLTSFALLMNIDPPEGALDVVIAKFPEDEIVIVFAPETGL